MTLLPDGLEFYDNVMIALQACSGDAYHRESGRPDGCPERTASDLRTEWAATAIGRGCTPCPACWPETVPPAPAGEVRPATPWPGNGAGYQSRRPERLRPSAPADAGYRWPGGAR